jgi:hypothetical protein
MARMKVAMARAIVRLFFASPIVIAANASGPDRRSATT